MRLARRAAGVAAAAIVAILLAAPAASRAGALKPAELRLLQQRATSADDERAGKELANRLGRQSSIEGLEAILSADSPYWLRDYLDGLRSGNGIRTLDPAMEALIVRYYAKPNVHDQLVQLLVGAEYHSQALYRLLLGSLKDAVKDREHLSWAAARSAFLTRALVHTDLPGIEQSVLDLCPTLPRQPDAGGRFPASLRQTSLGEAVNFLAQRKYVPAVPYLATLIDRLETASDRPPGEAVFFLEAMDGIDRAAALRAGSRYFDRASRSQRRGNVQLEMAGALRFLSERDPQLPTSALAALLREDGLAPPLVREIVVAITRHPDREGVRALVDRMARAGQRADYRPDGPADEPALVLSHLAGMKDPSLIDYAQLQRALPATLGQTAKASYTRLLQARTDLAQAQHPDRAREFEAKRAKLRATQTALLKLEEPRPDQYASSYAGYLADAERLVREYSDVGASAGLRTDIANDYVELGHLVRFRLKQTRKAIELYAAADKLGSALGALALADTYRFDLHDTTRALKEFQRIQERLQRAPAPANDMDAGLGRWAAKWVAREIDFLNTGKPFKGAIAQEDVAGIGAIVYFGAGPGAHDYLGLAPLYRSFASMAEGRQSQIDRGELARKLQALPASTFTLMRTLPALTAMPDAESMLRYLEKHDPAGYATACFFGLIDLVARQGAAPREAAQLLPGLALPPSGAANPLRAAAARFAERRGIAYDALRP